MSENFRHKNLRQSDAEKLLILLEENRKLKSRILELDYSIETCT